MLAAAVLGVACAAAVERARGASEPPHGSAPSHDPAPKAPEGGDRARRLAKLQDELARLEREMESLKTREKGLLGDVDRYDAEIALERARVEEASLHLRGLEERLTTREKQLAALEAAQARRARALAPRLREMYKRGSLADLAALVAPAGPDARDGMRYASFLAARDGAQLAEWREADSTLRSERDTMAAERAELRRRESSAAQAQVSLESSRRQRESLLEKIRGDREQHAAAIGELDAAAKDLAKIVGAVDDRPGVQLDVRKFRGLLDWPASGPVGAGYGKVIHPRFKTEIPHPGLDIDAPDGATFRSVFDGRVAYAAVLHGYGLTVVVDHGNGVVSVYAHAGVLLVATGDEVARGQELGRVGDSGSLRGPYLYFELREAGKPVDPVDWLRPR